MKAKTHRRHDTKIATTAAQSPEEIGVLRCISSNEPTIGENNLSTEQVVQSQSKLGREWTVATSQEKASYADGSDIAGYCGEAVLAYRSAHIRGRGAAGSHRCLCGRIHRHLSHQGEVDYEPAVA